MKNSVASKQVGEVGPPIQSLHNFCGEVGISPITAWRFRNRGWLSTINISGRQYVSAEAIIEFKRRAAAGEFSKPHPTPSSPKPAGGKTR